MKTLGGLRLALAALAAVFMHAQAHAQAAPPADTVTGSFTMNGKTTPLKHVYALVKPDAFEEGTDVTVIYLTDVPVTDDMLRDDFGLFQPARDGKLHAIEVKLDADKKPAHAHLYHQELEGGTLSLSGANEFEPKPVAGKRLSGRLHAGPEESFGNKWEYHADFNVAVLPKPPETLAALDSPPAKVALAFVKAARMKDKAGLKRVITPEMAADLDGPRGPELLAMLPDILPPSLQLSKVVMRAGDKAVVTFKSPKGDETATLKAALRDGEWKITK